MVKRVTVVISTDGWVARYQRREGTSEKKLGWVNDSSIPDGFNGRFLCLVASHVLQGKRVHRRIYPTFQVFEGLTMFFFVMIGMEMIEDILCLGRDDGAATTLWSSEITNNICPSPNINLRLIYSQSKKGLRQVLDSSWGLLSPPLQDSPPKPC